MKVASLPVMQDGFRNMPDSLAAMRVFVQQGGRFDLPSLAQHGTGDTKLIALTQFEDQRIYVHDSVHRLAAIFMARSPATLHPSEFIIREFTYSQYGEINWELFYITPFDPRKEVRVADLSEFRRKVRELQQAETEPSEFIWQHRDQFALPRGPQHESIADLVNYYLPNDG